MSEELGNIKARLKSFRCSLCHGWVTPKEQRPSTVTAETEMCSCPRGYGGSLYSDVNEDDVEWLVSEVEKLREVVAVIPLLVLERFDGN